MMSFLEQFWWVSAVVHRFWKMTWNDLGDPQSKQKKKWGHSKTMSVCVGQKWKGLGNQICRSCLWQAVCWGHSWCHLELHDKATRRSEDPGPARCQKVLASFNHLPQCNTCRNRGSAKKKTLKVQPQHKNQKSNILNIHGGKGRKARIAQPTPTTDNLLSATRNTIDRCLTS